MRVGKLLVNPLHLQVEEVRLIEVKLCIWLLSGYVQNVPIQNISSIAEICLAFCNPNRFFIRISKDYHNNRSCCTLVNLFDTLYVFVVVGGDARQSKNFLQRKIVLLVFLSVMWNVVVTITLVLLSDLYPKVLLL